MKAESLESRTKTQYHLERVAKEEGVRYEVTQTRTGSVLSWVNMDLVDNHYVLTCDTYGMHASPVSEGVQTNGVFGVFEKDNIEEAEKHAREKGMQLIERILKEDSAPYMSP